MLKWVKWMLLLILYSALLIAAGAYFLNKQTPNVVTFNFFINETREALNGEISANNASLGEVKHGTISISKSSLNFSSFIFKVNYKNQEHYFEYDFPEYYRNYRSINFIVLKEQIESGRYAVGNRSIMIYFYDNKTGCKLSGKIYIDNKLIGRALAGYFILNEDVYKEKFKFNSSLHIFGVTDSCFGRDVDLPFAAYWNVYNLENYFAMNETLTLSPSLNPRQPEFEIEMQAFIRPKDVSFYLSEFNKYISDARDAEENLDVIAGYSITYATDKLQFGQEEYWQTPIETLRNKKGDCEDWAITTLSLMRAYNESIKCYNALWPEHISIFCYFNNNFIIYDQGKVKSRTALNLNVKAKTAETVNQENRIALRNMLNRYFDSYGLGVKDRKLFALFNEQELVKFENNEEFIDWAVKLVQEG